MAFGTDNGGSVDQPKDLSLASSAVRERLASAGVSFDASKATVDGPVTIEVLWPSGLASHELGFPRPEDFNTFSNPRNRRSAQQHHFELPGKMVPETYMTRTFALGEQPDSEQGTMVYGVMTGIEGRYRLESLRTSDDVNSYRSYVYGQNHPVLSRLGFGHKGSKKP